MVEPRLEYTERQWTVEPEEGLWGLAHERGDQFGHVGLGKGQK